MRIGLALQIEVLGHVLKVFQMKTAVAEAK